MITPSGRATYASFTPGTVAYANAVRADYEANLIEWSTAEALLKPYYDPATGAPLSGTRWWPTLSELGSAANIAISSWAKYSQIEYQRDLEEFRLEQAKYKLASGMMGEGGVPSYGGLNVWTLLMFGGVAALALFLLKK